MVPMHAIGRIGFLCGVVLLRMRGVRDRKVVLACDRTLGMTPTSLWPPRRTLPGQAGAAAEDRGTRWLDHPISLLEPRDVTPGPFAIRTIE
ncbi:hypothetical protein B1L11_03675 [Microbispora sp. GKU 823]|nr:hypothetical protein B1L11_03675 [Microbispora sp. GKU 823]